MVGYSSYRECIGISWCIWLFMAGFWLVGWLAPFRMAVFGYEWSPSKPSLDVNSLAANGPGWCLKEFWLPRNSSSNPEAGTIHPEGRFIDTSSCSGSVSLTLQELGDLMEGFRLWKKRGVWRGILRPICGLNGLLGSKVFMIYFHDHKGKYFAKVKEMKVKWMLAQDTSDLDHKLKCRQDTCG